MAVTLYGPSQVGASFSALISRVFPSTLRSTRSPAPNSLFLKSLLYLRASFYWYFASRIVVDSQRSSNKFNCFNNNSEFWAGLNPVTWALHRFISASITASAPYVREKGVSLVDLLGCSVCPQNFRQLLWPPALRTFNLLFNPFTIALLEASAWLLLCGYAGVEYRFTMPRLLQYSRKALLSNCNPLFNTSDSGTPNLVTIFLHTNFLTSTSQMFANASTFTHLVK